MRSWIIRSLTKSRPQTMPKRMKMMRKKGMMIKRVKKVIRMVKMMMFLR